MFYTEEKLQARIQELAEYRYRDAIGIDRWLMQEDSRGEIGASPPEGGDWQTVRAGDGWRGYDAYVWLKTEVEVPASWQGRTVVGRFYFGRTGISNIAGFESLLYLNGVPYQGVDSNHPEVFLPEGAAGSKASLVFRLWSGLYNHVPALLGDWSVLGPARRRFHADPDRANLHEIQEHRIGPAQIALLDEPADDLYFLSRAAIQTVGVLDERHPDRHALLACLNRAFRLVDWSKPGSGAFYDSVLEARNVLRSELARHPKASSVTVKCVGHTHIDVAWLWQLKHTREKAARSFSTVLRLMERFPEYAFLQSQPQLYEYIKSDYPQLYAQIQERVRQGAWEASGGMWLEADCNLTSGESLVRQLLLGTRFLREEFGVECTYLWLPDVFGYSWALPQILRKSGIDAFMTNKVFTNQYNQMPHHTFRWKGIDGTEVLTHFAGYTYNGIMDAESIQALWDRYRDKEWNRELLFVYGYGDGGGGVNRDMLEMRRRLNELPGMPRVETSRADDYFENLHQTAAETDQYVHTWEGELYFEYHRGTYTSQAFVKKANRKCELGLREAEWLNVIGALQDRGGWAQYPGETLLQAWKIVLRNQFHDIIPGSSIREVYEDCVAEYAEAETLIRQAWSHGASKLATAADTNSAAEAVTVFNGSTWDRSDLVRLPAGDKEGTWLDPAGLPLAAQRSGEDWLVLAEDVPSLGYACLRFEPDRPLPSKAAAFQHRESGMITPYYEIEWNAKGQLTRIYDRQFRRDVLAEGEKGNVLQIFEDKPMAHDAWDIDIFYQEKQREVDALTHASLEESGPLRAVVAFRWTYGDSVIRQRLAVYAHSRRIDFETSVDWHERQQLLKAAFPVAIRATEATYDIQFGNVKRPTHWNTSWDYARFESVGQQWADLSERGYGVSLLNDCKYGYDIKNHVMRLTLLTSSIYPDHAADQGRHDFTYSLLPHAGDWLEGETAREAWSLNNPLSYRSGKPERERFRLFGLSGVHAMVDAVKKAEDGDEVVLRIHEYAGGRGTVEIRGDVPIRQWQECDLMERPIGEPSGEGVISAFMLPYEIKTFLIRVKED